VTAVLAIVVVVIVIALLLPAFSDSDWSAIRNFDLATYAASAGVIVAIFALASGVVWWRRRR
jgi:amino acid transporter